MEIRMGLHPRVQGENVLKHNYTQSHCYMFIGSIHARAFLNDAGHFSKKRKTNEVKLINSTRRANEKQEKEFWTPRPDLKKNLNFVALMAKISNKVA